MRLNNSYFYTLRENPKDEESTSGTLLNRAGYIRKSSSGIYMYLPLGYKVLTNIEKIIREEMDKTGSQELLMPCLITEDYYISSGRRANFGSSMFSLQDRFNKTMVLGPTHEELFAVAAGMKIRSYKDLPFSLYQLQTKFRDEPRPRFGLIRVREFIMKDAYTFDKDLEGLDIQYGKVFQAYKNIFDRLGINYKIVKADTGVMGGLLSEEFQALSDIGEDTIVTCDSCDFSSNVEVAACVKDTTVNNDPLLEKELVYTPNAGTIEEVSSYLGKKPEDFVKTLIYKVDDHFVACLVKGIHEVNEVKLQKACGANEVALAEPEDVVKITNAKVGFAGPIGLDIPIYMDQDIEGMRNFIVGANKSDYHYKNVNLSDFKVTQVLDLRLIQHGDTCPVCGGKIHFRKGIEIGNTFKLGDKYSKAMNLYFQDSDHQLKPVIMGSYGIGLGRTMAALAEQSHDENGLIWPVEISPYKVAIVTVNSANEDQVKITEQLEKAFMAAGIEPLIDDRNERAGVKFKDMDLIGIPYILTVGKLAGERKVEFKERKTGLRETLTIEEAIQKIID